MSIKLRIPDEDTLRGLVQPQVKTLHEKLVTDHHAEVTAYQKAQRARLFAILYLSAAAFLFVPAVVIAHTWLVVLWVGMVGVAVWAWWQYMTQLTAVQAFHRIVTTETLQTVADLFAQGDTFVHKYKKREPTDSLFAYFYSYLFSEQPTYQKDILAQLQHSELITEPYNKVVIDDSWEVQLLGRRLAMAELSISHETGSGKNRRVKRIFHGYFATYTLPTTFTGKTFLSTDGDRNGFGHQSFWTRHAQGAVNATTLEWNEFEDLLHVATNNPTEARYILTPDLMQDVYDWWVALHENIRLSFIDTHMYILFPDKKMRLHTSVADLTEDSLADYLFLHARPFLHVTHLAEDIRKRFR